MSIKVFKLEEYLGRYEFSAPYLLCCSDAESFSMNEVIDMSTAEDRDLWNNLRLGYTPVQGLPILREQIAASLYDNLTADNILCFAGAEEGIFCALYTICEEDDHVIVLTPCYQSLIEIPKLKNATVTAVRLLEENEWRIDLTAIKHAIKPNTKCIIINSPHNPTGQVISEEELNDLIDLCAGHDIWLFSDEVYRLLGREKLVKPAAVLYKKAISLDGMSKAFGMGGLRIGWIACQDKEMLKNIEAVKHYTSISNSASSEIISFIALKNMHNILKRNSEIIAKNLKLLDIFLEEYNNLFEWVRPLGGCIGFIKYKGNESVENFVNRLVKEKGVLLIPASIYDVDSNHFRIGFGRENMAEALSELKKFIELS